MSLYHLSITVFLPYSEKIWRQDTSLILSSDFKINHFPAKLSSPFKLWSNPARQEKAAGSQHYFFSQLGREVTADMEKQVWSSGVKWIFYVGTDQVSLTFLVWKAPEDCRLKMKIKKFLNSYFSQLHCWIPGVDPAAAGGFGRVSLGLCPSPQGTWACTRPWAPSPRWTASSAPRMIPSPWATNCRTSLMSRSWPACRRRVSALCVSLWFCWGFGGF